jgi:hypothetical protein
VHVLSGSKIKHLPRVHIGSPETPGLDAVREYSSSIMAS